jgi:hypothetical protein
MFPVFDDFCLIYSSSEAAAVLVDELIVIEPRHNVGKHPDCQPDHEFELVLQHARQPM